MNVLASLRQMPGSALRLVGVRALSSLGSATTSFALNVWVYQQTGSYSIFATLAIVTALPGLLFAPIAGAIVDRYSRQRLLILCDAFAALTILVVLLASMFSLLTIWIVGGASVVLALLRTLAWPASAAAVSQLTTPEQRPRINGVNETLEGVVVVASPALGVMLFEMVGIPGVAIADVVSYLVCMAVVASIVFADDDKARAAAESQESGFSKLWVDCTFGFRWIFAHRDLTRLLLFLATINLACSVFVVAYTPYILSFSSPSMLAVCLVCGGAGTIVGGAAFTASGGLRRSETGVLIGAMTLGAAMALFGISRTSSVLFIAAFFYGAALPLINASSQTIWQSRVPIDLQGRVFSVRRMIAWGLNPISVLLSIPLVTTVFEPALHLGGGNWNLAQLWGSGPPGAIGLMLSLGGIGCLGVATYLLHCDGLRIETGAAIPASSEIPLTV